MRKFMSTILAGGLALTMMAGASAATSEDGDATVEVICSTETPCVLSVEITGDDFGDVPYDLVDPGTANGTIEVTAKDDRGTGKGWYVTIYGEDFDSRAENPFPVSGLALTPALNGLDSTLGQDTTGVTPTGTVNGVPNSAGNAVTILDASLNHGRGHYTSEYDATLTVPAGTLIDTYTSTLTVTIYTLAP